MGRTRSQVSQQDRELFSGQAKAAEELGRLTASQHKLLLERRFYLLYVPRSLGGLEMEFPEALSLLEELAYVDGSVGWTTTLCSGAAWFVGFMEPQLADEVFSNPNQCCVGGSGMQSGFAKALDSSSYGLEGQWKYATGAPYLSWYTMNTQVGEELRSFCVPKDKVQLIEDWNTMGLKATASHSFRVNACQVPKWYAFQIDPNFLVLKGAIYCFPFQQFAELTLAVNYMGMIRRFRELQADQGLEEETTWQTYDRVLPRFWELSETAWMELKKGAGLSNSLALQISKHSRALVKHGLSLVSTSFPRSGMLGAHLDSEINRVWRNLFTASQHQVFR